jgi:hypothetical protein
MSISQNGLPSKYPDAAWDGWSGKIIGELNLKRTSKTSITGHAQTAAARIDFGFAQARRATWP